MLRAVAFQHFRQTGVGIRKVIALKKSVLPRIRIGDSHVGSVMYLSMRLALL